MKLFLYLRIHQQFSLYCHAAEKKKKKEKKKVGSSNQKKEEEKKKKQCTQVEAKQRIDRKSFVF